MGSAQLVKDQMTRRLEGRYVEAAAGLEGAFTVLTNGEHGGRHGVNRLVKIRPGGVASPR